MTYELLAQAIRDTARKGDLQSLRAFVNAEHPADLANFLGGLEPRDAWTVLDLLPVEEQAEVFGYLGRDFQVEIARHAPRDKLAGIVTEMHADERADLFNELTEAQQEALLPALAQAEREDIRRLAGYAEDTAGAIMTSDYATLIPALTAAEAIEHLRREAPDKETIYRAYVIGPDRRLIGSVRLRDLIVAPSRAKVSDIMETNTLAVRVDDDQELVARQIAKYDVLAVPVVDADGRLVGIVTHDDAMDVMQEEATEDFHRVGTVSKFLTNVRDASILMLYRSRIFWLVILVFGNIFSGAGIAYFEDTIAAYVALVFFLPLLIDSGGNAGSQAATLMVRALATGDVKMADWGWMLGREVAVAALLGLTMAIAVSAIGVIRAGPEIALVVSLSMVIIVIVGSLIGMTLPFILTRLNLDPATASAPLVTSIADATGVIIYFALATAFLFPAVQ
ncbi:MAG: magnesium transporter [Rhodospirillales bacterium]|nr:MAG: magnesium transporter [Rhodospirillales bacterium]